MGAVLSLWSSPLVGYLRLSVAREVLDADHVASRVVQTDIYVHLISVAFMSIGRAYYRGGLRDAAHVDRIDFFQRTGIEDIESASACHSTACSVYTPIPHGWSGSGLPCDI